MSSKGETEQCVNKIAQVLMSDTNDDIIIIHVVLRYEAHLFLNAWNFFHS